MVSITLFLIPEHYLPWRVKKTIEPVTDYFKKVSLLNVRFCLCSEDKEITIQRADRLKIKGSLYGVVGGNSRPGIILLHGNTPLGRKLAIYKVLSSKLAEQGYLVLTIDFTGFGESDDPFSLDTVEALDRDKDVYTAIEFLKTLQIVDTSQIYIIGHSGGAVPAFRVGIKDTCIKGIIAIGPPRRVTERLNDPRDKNYFWKRAIRTRREVYGKEFPAWYTEDLWLERNLKNDMKKYKGYFSQNLHKPLLLIDGELESEKDKLYLRNFFNGMTEPKRYITLKNSGHYCNTMSLLGSVLYDIKVINQTTNAIDRWRIESAGITNSAPSR